MNRPRTRMYLITPPRIELETFVPLLDETLAAGDVGCLQLRLKTADGGPEDHGVIGAALEAIKPIAAAHDVALLVNDSPALAKQYDCDGVHIGQEDGDYKQARALLGDDKIIGVTCHNSRHMAMTAGDAGADYVAFGAFYPSQTKQTESVASVDILSWWLELMQPPCVAIGGITVDNAAPLVMAGADFLAVSSSVWNHEGGPAAAIASFNALLDGQFTTLFDTLNSD
ncbi:thiamine phosphate synthase [Alphaproteobacteria bacterium]|nr:thiamine phosphate synthase [Alphaproteobacteria bacterium]